MIRGAAGTNLALASLPACRAAHLKPLTRYLTGLCDGADLPKLHVGSNGGDPMAGWNLGRVNMGLGHGLPGVLAALIAAWPHLADAEREPVARSIRVAAAFLIRHSSRDAQGVVCWPFAAVGIDGSDDTGPITQPESRRQGWCWHARRRLAAR